MTAEPGRDKPLLTPRAALIFVTSLIAALVIGALTYAARHSMPEAAIAGCGAFVTAAVFLNRVIELPVSPASGAAQVAALRRLRWRWSAHLTRPFTAATWSSSDLLYAIDHELGGRARERLTDVRHPVGWLRWRLAAWLDPDGRPLGYVCFTPEEFNSFLGAAKSAEFDLAR